MNELFSIPAQVLFGQLLVGVINGSFYAMLSLGLAVIFGLLNIVNFTHGAQYMLGAFCAWIVSKHLGLGYWYALIAAPLAVGAVGCLIEFVFLKRIYRSGHLYGLLLTFGLALVIEGLFRQQFGSSGPPYPVPASLQGGQHLGFMFLPNYRAWVIAASAIVCFGTWFVIERTRLGAYLRAATENPALVASFGINVPRMVTLTYGFGVALAAMAGVMAAPIYQISPQMGSNIIIVVFAVVVIGGMGSIVGAVVAGFCLGVIEGMTKVFYPQASSTVIFIVMVIVLLARPAGMFGKDESSKSGSFDIAFSWPRIGATKIAMAGAAIAALTIAAPFLLYPVFLMKALCFALFACAFNLLAGFGGLLSFGHAAFFGTASYVTAYAAKMWGMPPELGILLGTSVSAALGVAMGWLAIRRRGIYFGMVTLALSQMIYFLALQSPLTGGEDGIQGVPRGMLLGVLNLEDTLTMYYFVAAIFLLGVYVIYRTVHSPFGHVLLAIKENEQRAVSLGYNVDSYKLVAFIVSAALSGLAGSTKSLVFQLASLTDIHWIVSGEVMLMVLIGGIGTITGPLIGAFVIIAMQNYLSDQGAWVAVIQGSIFILCVLAFKRGIVGAVSVMLSRIRGRPRVSALVASQ
nr:hypothetical protein [Nitrosomonas nitrosa]